MDDPRALQSPDRTRTPHFAIVVSYAVAIGLFALIVPLTVQELVNTFAFAIQPDYDRHAGRDDVGACCSWAHSAFCRDERWKFWCSASTLGLAIAFTEALPRFRENVFLPEHTNTFIEAELLPRALVAMLIDFVNVSVSA